jgi:glucose-6-phosphate 1-dehydrogenase
LAIPPSLFETVIRGLGEAKLAELGRVIVEKPFGRDLASARKLNEVAHRVFPEDSIFLHSGKYLPDTATEVLVELKPPPPRKSFPLTQNR